MVMGTYCPYSEVGVEESTIEPEIKCRWDLASHTFDYHQLKFEFLKIASGVFRL